MYPFLSVLCGVVIAIMVYFNGNLTQHYGTYFAAVIIHVVGVVFALVLCIVRKEKIKHPNGAPLWVYLGGVIGVLTTLCNNFAFGRISLTSIVALGLLGQSLTSVALDSQGWLGSPKKQITKTSLLGFLPAFLGVLMMLDGTIAQSFVAVFLALTSGVAIVLSRTVNASLSAKTSPLVGSFINHLVGLPLCIVLVFALEPTFNLSFAKNTPWMYLGGVLGVMTVLLFNVTVPKIAAFSLTLLSFVGQVFTGVVLDIALGIETAKTTFFGGVIIAFGLLVNMALARKKT